MSLSSIIRIVIWFVMIFGGVIIGFYLDSILFNEIQSNITFNVISFGTGIILAWLVIRVSANTGRILAKYGREGNIKRMETNVLTTVGIYKYMRHPMHLGLLFLPVVIGFLVGSPSFIIIVAPIEIVLMLIMIKFLEEPEAIRKFGLEYLDYMKQVPWFCFKVECLEELFRHVPKNQKKYYGR